MSILVRAIIDQASNLKYLKVPSWFEGLNFITSAHLPQCGPWLSALQVQKSIFVNIKEIESLQVELKLMRLVKEVYLIYKEGHNFARTYTLQLQTWSL